MNKKIKKIDAIIIVALLIIAGIVFLRAGYIHPPGKPKTPHIEFEQDDKNNKLTVVYVSGDVLWINIEIQGECDPSSLTKYVLKGDEITNCKGKITLIYKPTQEVLGSWFFTEKEELPESPTLYNERTVDPEDEGPHYTKLMINREWWYYTVVFDSDSELPGWTLTVSFNHMARNDLFWEKPDLLIVVLHSPDGKEYGGIVERKRPLLGEYSFLKEPVLQASSSSKGFKVTFEDSYIQGKAPDWHVHVEGEDIDPKHDLVIDLQYFAPSPPIWIYSNKVVDKSRGSIASYIFTGCTVTGTVEIDRLPFKVKGVGHHEHTWVSSLITKGLIRGWDWCHITLDNGWNIYYSNYYFTPQFKSIETIKINPFASLIITTDKGETITRLGNVEVEILNSDKIFLSLNIPVETGVTAKTGPSQLLLQPYEINLVLNIKADNTYDHLWKRFVHVGMKIGRCTVYGEITWSDEDGDHDIDLNGVGTIWNMRH